MGKVLLKYSNTHEGDLMTVRKLSFKHILLKGQMLNINFTSALETGILMTKA
jgi:hypothetical protein